MLALRYVYVLALVIWLGGMVILGALVAPTTFQVLPSIEPSSGRALAGELFARISDLAMVLLPIRVVATP